MKNNWNGLLEIEYIEHLDENNKVIWFDKNLTNILHNTGEKFLLELAFSGGEIPNYYLFGLDNRTNLTLSGGDGGDSLIYPSVTNNVTTSNPTGEPTGNGYYRVSVANSSFVVELQEDNHFKAKALTVAFTATGSGWGPINNLFLAYINGSYETVIIASVKLSQSLTLSAGQVINMKMALKLRY